MKSKGEWLYVTSKSQNLPWNAKIDNEFDRKELDDQIPNSDKNLQIC